MIRRSVLFRGAAALAMLALAGCSSLRSTYQPVAVATPAGWADGANQPPSAAPTGGPWWRAFGDPNLDRLVETVLERNNNLAAAAVALQKAQAQAHIAVVNPTVSGGFSDTETRPLGGGLPRSTLASDSLTVGYQVDLFDSLAAQRDVAVWEARATRQDLESTRLTLIGSTINLYYQAAYLNQRIALEDQSIAYAQKTLDLVRAQRGAGAASALDLAQADQQLASQQASLHDLINQRVAARNSITLLLNGRTWDPAQELQALPDGPLPAVDPGLPASLLARRPDLRAAELRLREQLASLDATRLSFYPVISLTGSLGNSSTALSDLIKNPVGTLGADVTLPFLQADQMHWKIKGARLDYDKAVINYRQTLYQAFADVDNALAAREQYADETTLLQRSLDDALKAERLYEVLYRNGSVALKSWLDEQETRRQAEVSLAQNRLNEINTHVTLYEALGGDMPAARAAP